VFQKLIQNAHKRGIAKIRISVGEPTLCFGHLISVLNMVKHTPYPFILETNRLSLGMHPEYVERLEKYQNIHIRVSIKPPRRVSRGGLAEEKITAVSPSLTNFEIIFAQTG